MAAKKAAAKKPISEADSLADLAGEPRPDNPSGFDKLAAQEPTDRAAPASNDIDDRMAALLKDHQAMGARPLKEPVTIDKAG